MFKVFQKLNDQKFLQENTKLDKFNIEHGLTRKINGFRKVPLDSAHWNLEYRIDVSTPDISKIPRLHEDLDLSDLGDEQVKWWKTEMVENIINWGLIENT